MATSSLLDEISGLDRIMASHDGRFELGRRGVTLVASTKDGKVEFVAWDDRVFAYVKSEMGYPAMYPFHLARIERPLEAVLMDLDGTTVRSEGFWIWIIQSSVASLLVFPRFELEESDLPFVSGHSVSEHLSYCVKKYCPDKSVEEARRFYIEHTRREMALILEGRGKAGAFSPAEGIKDFLLDLKAKRLKIALVTSGLYEKAYPEILSAFATLGLGDPAEFYDCIITAGYPLGPGVAGTLGELSPKPHPWLYAEVARIGLGIPFERRTAVVGIEDSGAGICSIRLAGFAAIGISGGNIDESGTSRLCLRRCENFGEVLKVIEENQA
jgi:beta-phosphoglucomutase